MIEEADMIAAGVVVGMVVIEIIGDHQCHMKTFLNQVKVNVIFAWEMFSKIAPCHACGC